MTRQPLIARHAEELLGSAVVATAPVNGGDVCVATKLRLSDGTTALMKTLNNAPDGFFAAEADGLRWLASAGEGGLNVPEVLAADEGCLILRWVEPGRPSADAATSFGRALATTHRRRRPGVRRRARRLHRPPAPPQQGGAHLGGVLRPAPGAAVPQARP